MSKTLSHILTIFKVAKIVAKVVFILCIVGGIGCLVGLLCLALVGDSISAERFLTEGLNLSSAYLACTVGAITCAGEAILAYLSERYFKNVLTAGTPFSLDGAKECFRLGIASIIVSVAVLVLVGGVSLVFSLFSASIGAESDFNASFSLSTGLFFLFLSLIFKHGAELQPSSKPEET